MLKESRVFARVDVQTKLESEAIFKALGLSMSDGIGIFLKQVIAKNGIPFPVTLDDRKD